MEKRLFLNLLFLLLLFTRVDGQSKFSEIEKFLNSVVYISEPIIETVNHNGRKHEVWLKDIKGNNFFPRIKYITDSGF